MQRGFKRKFEPVKILSDSQVEHIHTSAVSVLGKTGFQYDSDKALKLLEKNGFNFIENRKDNDNLSNIVFEIRKASR